MRVLTEEADAERQAFLAIFEGSCCSCHLSPPCNFCVHPGNPTSQEEDDECWLEVPDDAQAAVNS